MLRKFLAAILAAFLVIGGLYAEELKGVFRKYEDGKVTVEVDGQTKEYKLSPDAKFKTKKGREKAAADVIKLVKEGAKGIFTVEGGAITKFALDTETKK
jgi:hypothetical protein